MPLVGVIVGSKSDRPLIDETSEVLDQLGVEHEVVVASAHRTPEAVMEWTTSARDRGIEVIIAAAGGSAGLPGVAASWTTLPVIGIPVPSSDLEGNRLSLFHRPDAAGYPRRMRRHRLVGSAKRRLPSRPDTRHQARLRPSGLRRVPPGPQVQVIPIRLDYASDCQNIVVGAGFKPVPVGCETHIWPHHTK